MRVTRSSAQDIPFWVEQWTCSGASTSVWLSVPIIALGDGTAIVNTTAYFSAQTPSEVNLHVNNFGPSAELELPVDSYRVFLFSSARQYSPIEPLLFKIDNKDASSTNVQPYSRLYARSISPLPLPVSFDVVMPNTSAAFVWTVHGEALVVAGGDTALVVFQASDMSLTLSVVGSSHRTSCAGLLFSCDVSLSSVSCGCGGAQISVPNPSPQASFFYCSSPALMSTVSGGSPSPKPWQLQPRVVVRHTRVAAVAVSVELSTLWRFHYSFSHKLHRLPSDSLYPTTSALRINMNGQILSRSSNVYWSQFTRALSGFPLCGPNAYGDSFSPGRAPSTGNFDVQVFHTALASADVRLALVSSGATYAVIAESRCSHVSSTTILCHFGTIATSGASAFVQVIVGQTRFTLSSAGVLKFFSTASADMPIFPTSVGLLGGTPLVLDLSHYAGVVGPIQMLDTLFPSSGTKGVHMALSGAANSTFDRSSAIMLGDPVITNSSDLLTVSAEFVTPTFQAAGVVSIWVSLFPGQWSKLESQVTVIGMCGGKLLCLSFLLRSHYILSCLQTLGESKLSCPPRMGRRRLYWLNRLWRQSLFSAAFRSHWAQACSCSPMIPCTVAWPDTASTMVAPRIGLRVSSIAHHLMAEMVFSTPS